MRKGAAKLNRKSQGPAFRWGIFRLSIIGRLFANPPDSGQLCKELEKLSKCIWIHPVTGLDVTYSYATLERWYYMALDAQDPIAALDRKIRSDFGNSKVMGPLLIEELGKQYASFKHWSYKLHADNLAALVMERPHLGKAPSTSTVRRNMAKRGWVKRRSSKGKRTPGQQVAAERLEKREVRSYESSFVHGLWHLDYHESHIRVADAAGNWHTPKALCILDDCSRLCCHIQWYLGETAETLFHGLTQAFCKRGLPKGLMTDNGSAMRAHETRNGFERLGINHQKTLPHSPYQNGKQESFWGQLEGRLVAMIHRVEPLTLGFLNQATIAWAEMEYNKARHSEIGASPMERMLKGPNISTPAPELEAIRLSFTVRDSRVQRKSDGTIQINGIRFEVPSRFRHMRRLYIRYAGWDLSVAYLVDGRTGELLARIYPQDKTRNASGVRRTLERLPECELPEKIDSDPIPPHLRRLLADYAQTGMPPAYLPKEEGALASATSDTKEVK